jgi:two-component sensor histidine kinase
MEAGHQKLTRGQLEEQLHAALREQERLRRDMHHRIRNNLQVIASLLDLQADVAQDPQVDGVFANTQQRLQALARIHDSVAQVDDGGYVQAAIYLEELCKRLCEPYGPDEAGITVHLHADPIRLPVRRAITCGLLLQELLGNCFTHAFPTAQTGEIVITLRAQLDKVAVLTVRDNGVGLPAHVDFQCTESVGSQLICTLVEDLEGTLTVARATGTTVTVMFPMPTS